MKRTVMWPGKEDRRGKNGESGDLVVHIDNSWTDNCGIYIKGWILDRKGPLEAVHIAIGNDYVPIVNWHERPDIVPAFPGITEKTKCGFTVYIPHAAEHRLSFIATGQGETSVRTLSLSGSKVGLSIPFNDASLLFNEFIDRVNRDHLKVLEIGSRIVSPGSSSKRPLFPGAESFTGFDIYPDENTDVVGDAHKLSRYFPEEKFDAVFSVAVFEHLAMPWVVAREINKILKTGGITFHVSHFSWPLHEVPWDFYRYSDEGFKSLFPPPMGYKILKSGMFSPLRMYFDTIQPGQEEMPFYPGFGGSAILAEKVFDVDDFRFRWDTDIEEVLGKESTYPKKLA
jgi:SAM-dependent methyltransferase